MGLSAYRVWAYLLAGYPSGWREMKAFGALA